MPDLTEIRCNCDSKKKKGWLLGKVENSSSYILQCMKCKKIHIGKAGEKNKNEV